jgi:hypothetical protein
VSLFFFKPVQVEQIDKDIHPSSPSIPNTHTQHNMPARKILIIAGTDGLILSPIQNLRSTRSPPSKIPPGTVRIEYKTTNVIPHLGGTGAADKDIGGGLQVHGIVGMSPACSAPFVQ